MGFLKSNRKVKSETITIGKLSNLFLLIDKLKKQKVLQTTDQGIFFTYPEILNINKDPSNFLKNLYVYARNCNLIKKGQVLQIRNNDGSQLMASILADSVTLHE